MSPLLSVPLFIAVAGGATILLCRLLPRRWAYPTRITLANLTVYFTAWGLALLRSSVVPSFDLEFSQSLITLLMAPQQMVVLHLILRPESLPAVVPTATAAIEPHDAVPNGVPSTSPTEPAAVIETADAVPSVEPSASPTEPAVDAVPSDIRSALRRYWVGDYPLGVAFWGILGTAQSLSMVPQALVAHFLEFEPAISESVFWVLQIVGFAIPTAIFPFLLVGAMRSARRRVKERHAIGRRAVWARTTQAYVYFAWAMTLLNVGSIAFLAYTYTLVHYDTSIPPYALRVMRDGSEMEVTGGFRAGLTRDVERVLREHPGIRVVHLDSGGGQAGEGDRMFRLIRRRKLDTHVADTCASACTLAFVGGAERWIDREARVGFHAGTAEIFGDWLNRNLGPLASIDMKTIYLRAGIDPAFVAKALATPNKSILIPKPWELLAANVATRVSGYRQFAVSGLGSDPDAESFLLALGRMFPILHPLSDGWEDDYDNILADVVDAWRNGYTRDQLDLLVEDRAAELAVTELADADGATVTEVLRLWADTFAALAASDPSRCRPIAAERRTTGVRSAAADIFPDRSRALVQTIIVDRPSEFHGVSDGRLARANAAFVDAARRDLGTEMADRLSQPVAEVDAAVLCETWRATLVRATSWDPEIRFALAWRFGL